MVILSAVVLEGHQHLYVHASYLKVDFFELSPQLKDFFDAWNIAT